MYEELVAILHSSAPGTIVLTALAFILLIVLIWHLTSQVAGAKEDPKAISINRLVALIGALCGWIIGVAFVPFSQEEQQQFQAIGSIVSAFLSGYVVSKVDRYLEGVLFPIGPESKDSWARIGLFVASFLLVAIAVFLNRQYAFRVLAP